MAENPRIEELRRRVQLDPASIAFAALAEEFRRMGRHEEAIETCRAGLQRHPAYLSARVTLGRALIETGDYDAARDELETVLRSAPENLAAIRGLAQIHERLGQSTEMDPHLAAALNAEVERVTLAAAQAVEAPAPVAEAPVQVAEAPVQVAEAPVQVIDAPIPVVDAPVQLVEAPAAPVTEFVGPEPEPEPEPELEPEPEPEPEPLVVAAAELVLEEPEPVFEEPEDAPDPVMLATLARLERFLVAIDAARHP